MLLDIIKVEPKFGHRLSITFEDGVTGVVSLADILEFTGVFSQLESQSYFEQVRVNPDSGTVQWPNGADLDPDVLYSIITNKPIQLNSSILQE